MWSRLRRLTSTQALARKGRELPTIEIEWLTAKWYYNRPGCPKTLQVPFDKGRLNCQLRRKHRDRRWSFDEKLEWSERNIPEIVDDMGWSTICEKTKRPQTGLEQKSTISLLLPRDVALSDCRTLFASFDSGVCYTLWGHFSG